MYHIPNFLFYFKCIQMDYYEFHLDVWHLNIKLGSFYKTIVFDSDSHKHKDKHKDREHKRERDNSKNGNRWFFFFITSFWHWFQGRK